MGSDGAPPGPPGGAESPAHRPGAADTGAIRPSDPTEDLPAVTDDSPSKHVRIFGSNEYFRLWTAQVVGSTGDWVGLLAITSLAATIAPGSPEAAISLVMLARVAPGFFLAPLAGLIVDRFDRRKIMVLADCGRAGAMLTLPFVDSVLGLVVVSFVLELFTMLWGPAKEALVPNMVPATHLTTVNSIGLVAAYGTFPIAGGISFLLVVANDWLAEITWLSWAGFGRTFTGGGQTLLFYFDAVTFLVSALIVWRLKVPSAPNRAPRSQDQPRFAQAFVDLKEGWRFIVVNPVVRAVNIGLATGLTGGMLLVPLGATYATRIIGDAAAYNLFITALGMGVAGGVGLVSALQNRLPKPQIFLVSVAGAGVAIIFAVSMSNVWLACLGVLLVGTFGGSTYVLGFTLLHLSTSDELRGRIFSTLLTLVRLCVLLALTLGPSLSSLFDRLARRFLDIDPSSGLPSVQIGGLTYPLPGVRLALWFGGFILLVAAVLASRAMRVGLREGVLKIREEALAQRSEPSSARPETPRADGSTPDATGADNAGAGAGGAERSPTSSTPSVSTDGDA